MSQALLVKSTGKRPRCRPRPRWSNCVSDLAWSRLGMEPAELSEIAVDREVFQFSCGGCPCNQWCAEVWWGPGRLLDWMPPFQILVMSSGVWWLLLLIFFCLWRHNITSYSRWQTNVLSKFFDTTCIFVFKDAGEAVGQREQKKSWGQWKLIKNKKIVTNYVCFCSSTMLTWK